jgi:hypothetical protein
MHKTRAIDQRLNCLIFLTLTLGLHRLDCSRFDYVNFLDGDIDCCGRSFRPDEGSEVPIYGWLAGRRWGALIFVYSPQQPLGRVVLVRLTRYSFAAIPKAFIFR